MLVAEDDRSVRELIAEVLIDAGYSVATASDGRIALSTCEEFRPDVVVLDLMMPTMDGLPFLRERGPNCDAQVVVVSAALHEVKAVENFAVSAFVKKPFEMDVLLSAVAGAAKTSHRRSSLN